MPADHVSLLLQSLGDTQNDVAASLRKLNCRGHRNSGGECPVARFLIWAGCTDVFVDHHIFSATAPNGQQVCCSTPRAAAAFVLRFDDGVYPDLVAQEDGDADEAAARL